MRTLALAALLLATGLVGLLASQNRGLRAERVQLIERARLPHPGLFLPEVVAPALDGSSVRLAGGAGEPQLLLYFNTSCPYCLASLPAWERVRATLAEDAVAIIGLSLDSAAATRGYAEEHELRFPVVLLEGARARALYRAGIVPQVVLVDGDGRVRYARPGVLEAGVALDSVLAAVYALGSGEQAARR
jgi:peroxiredoxin